MSVPTVWSQQGERVYGAKLPGGSFTLAMDREDLPFRDLCDLAIRNNAKRRFLFVSRVLGRHLPVRPATLRRVAAELARKVLARTGSAPAVLVGMAETATTLGQAVFREYLAQGGRGLYLESTRRPTGGPQAFGFAESHSHATAHIIHLPGPEDDPEELLANAPHVVVIDDEATTGRTAAGLVHELRVWRGNEGAPFAPWLAVILHWKQTEENDAAFQGIDSLAEGTFHFTPEGEMPEAPAATHQIDSRIPARRGIRHGSMQPQCLPPGWDTAVRPGENILVAGNGEYGFQPLLLAEALEAKGATAWIQATTRSPILPGGAIGHVRAFDALSGEGYREFLYNVPDDHKYDRVILCLEDEVMEATHPLWQIPRLEVRS